MVWIQTGSKQLDQNTYFGTSRKAFELQPVILHFYDLATFPGFHLLLESWYVGKVDSVLRLVGQATNESGLEGVTQENNHGSYKPDI